MCATHKTCSYIKQREFHLVKKTGIIFLVMFFVAGSMAFGAVQAKNIANPKNMDNAAVLKQALNVQMPFIANQGQVPDKQVLYYAKTMGGTVYVKESGEIVYFFPRSDASKGGILQENLVNGSKPRPVGNETSRARVNYFIGKDRHQWKTNLSTYHSLLVGEVYENITLHLKAYGKTVEKIFTVQPGGDPTQIELSLKGSDTSRVLETGELEVSTGKDIVRFSKPVAFQMSDGRQKNIPVAYRLAENQYGFKLGLYDASLPLIIDPCLSFSTFIGGSDDDRAFSVAVDNSGNAYIAGSTYSAEFTRPLSLDDETNSGDYDAFVVKIDPTTPGMVVNYTLIGGDLYDAIYGIAVEEDNNDVVSVYVTGETQSKNFPGTNGFYDKKIGGNTDAFVAKLGEDGSTLEYATYLGGGGPDMGYAIAVEAGCAYVAGETLSSNFPVTPGVVFAKSKGGADGFVTRMNSDGTDLSYSTYFGGNGDDVCRGITVKNGEAYVTGQTSSSDLTTINNLTADSAAVPGASLGGATDAFIAKFGDDYEVDLLYSTYVGGHGVEVGNAIAVTDTNRIYIAGETTGPFSYPGSVTPVAIGPLGGRDVFTVLLNESGETIDFHAFIGGSGLDVAHGMVADISGTFIVGETDSSDFPITDNGGFLNDGADQVSSDGFIVRLNPTVPAGSDPLVFSNYVGGAFNDVVRGISVKSLPDAVCESSQMVTRIYVTGYSDSTAAVDYDAVLGIVADSDNDGAYDELDNCICLPNADQANSDEDLLGDVCDNCDDKENDPVEYNTGDSMSIDGQECAITKFGLSPGDYWQPDYDCDDAGDACDDDDDNDGLPDWWEDKFFGDPVSPMGPGDDPDGEGLDNQEEFDDYEPGDVLDGPDPQNPDTDNDGWNDKWEAQANTSSIDAASYPDSTTFQEGIFVDKVNGADINLGAKVGDNTYPVKSIHAAVERLNLLEDGKYTIKFITAATNSPNNPDVFSKGDPEPDIPLVIGQNVIIDTGGAAIVLDGGSAVNWKQGIVLSPLAGDVTIDGLVIQNFDQGIVFQNSGCASLNAVEIKDGVAGIQLVEAFNLGLDLTGSTLSGNETGIEIETDSSDNTIQGGTILSSDIGVAVKGGTGNRIVDTLIGNSESDENYMGLYGVKIYTGAESLNINGGTIQSFDVGIGFETDGFSMTISENAVIQGCRVGIEFLENYLVNVDMTGTVYDTINLIGNDPVITNCDIAVLFTAGSANNTVSHGSLVDNIDGVVFQSCDGELFGEAPDDNRVIGTRIENNLNNGVSFSNGSGNRLENCIISGNETGAAFLDGSDNQLLSCTVTDNDIGVYIDRYSSGNVITGGTVDGNGSDNFQINGAGNRIEDVTLSSGNSLGYISGVDNSISGITLEGDGSGVAIVVPGGDVHLNDVIIKRFNVGIGFDLDAACLSFSGGSEIIGCDTCDAGILIDEKYMLNIDLGDTAISNFESAIKLLGGSSNNTIRGGMVTLNRNNGIHIEPGNEFPEENRFIGMDVIENDLNGIALLGGFNNQVIGCTIEGNNLAKASEGYGGIALMNGSGTIERSRISSNGCAGIYVDEAVDVYLSGNLIDHNNEGIHLAFANNVNILSNTIAINKGAGLFMETGASPTVQYNIIYNNSTDTSEPGEGEQDERYDIFFEGQFDATRLVENNVRLVSQIGLPPSNLSVDPLFTDPNDPNDVDTADDDIPDFTLENTSACIDATGKTAPGMDLEGRMRPRGFSWDMGAFESSSFADIDDDGMFDSWEQAIVDMDSRFNDISEFRPDDDADDDGISNLDEFKNGSDPLVPVNIVITVPSKSPHFTNSDTLPMVMSTINASSVVVSTGDVVTGGDGTWNSTITGLKPGHNVILVTASGRVDDADYLATDSLTVVLDDADPTLTVISPTSGGSYSTALESISISGFASDDTAIKSVNWLNGGSSGTAEGTVSWNTGPIALNDGVNTIQITAIDIFDKSGESSFQEIEVTKQASETIVNVEEDLSGGHTSNILDELDTDGDGFANDDEIACGSDPYIPDLIDDPAPIPAIPNFLYSTQSTYTEGEKTGLYIPDCLNPDIDGDKLPNWWEEQYFPGALLGDTAEDNGDGDFDSNGDPCHNLCEYERGTDPTEPQTIAFTLDVLRAFDDQGNEYAFNALEWLPRFGHTLEIQATWVGDPESVPPEVFFSLKQTSSHPGRAVNDPNPAEMGGNDGYPDWYYEGSIDQFHGPDFGLTAVPLDILASCESMNCFSQGSVSVTAEAEEGNTYIVYLHAWDFGGRTNVMVTDGGAGDNIGQTWIPEGSHKNGIGNAWKIGKDLDGDGVRDVMVIPSTLDPNADIDTIFFEGSSSYTAPLGDDFSNFEEYRGIVYTPTIGGALEHARLDPFRKDLFIRTQGFDDATGSPYIDDRPLPSTVVDQYYPFRMGKAFFKAGIDVHNTTGWGHDATEDRSPDGTGERPFYVYYGKGNVTEIVGDNIVKGSSDVGWMETWPKHEWEFKLVNDPEDSWTPIGYWRNTDIGGGSISHELGLDFEYGNAASGTHAYEIRKPLPHINILIVRNDHEGTFGSQTGNIQFVSASPPSPQNPLGTRYWRWSTKGYAWCQTTSNQESMYGLAVTLASPLRHYFGDRPYLDGSTWVDDDQDWDKVWSDTLQGWEIVTDGVLNPLSAVEDQTDQLNPIDGAMGDTPDGYWDGDKRLTAFSGDLNPFDINSNGLVELPVATGLNNIVNEYNLYQVFMHTTTHEVGHALAGPTHTNDPACLMYKYSNNWSRADDLSDIYRSLLRVHNITR
jgi:parallel beta-helix repeat protein